MFNSIISTNPASTHQFQSDLQARLEPIYAKINEIYTHFSKDNANREHYNLPLFTKPQVQHRDEEVNKEHITMLLKDLDAETEKKHQMQSTMKANGQVLALKMTDHQWAVTKKKVRKTANKHHIAQHVANQTIMPVSVKSNTNYFATSAIKRDMQQKHADTE